MKIASPSRASLSDPNARLFRILRVYCRISCVSVVALGCLVLLGWAFDIEVLKSVLPGLVTMKANTALSLTFSAISLSLLSTLPPPYVRYMPRFLAVFVMLIAACTLLEYAVGWNLGIDQLLFHDLKGSLGTSSPGRMSPASSTAFLAIGTALLLLDRRTRRSDGWAQVFSLWAVLMAMLAATGYAYHAAALSRILLYTQVALHTAVGLLLLSTAIFFSRPRSGIASDLTGDGSGSVMARRLLPAVFMVPIFLGWISLRGQFTGLYGTEMRLALYASSNVIVFAILVWLNARKMNHEYARRNKAQIDLYRLNVELEKRVADRTRALEQQTTVLAQQAALLDLAQDAIIVRDMQNRIVFWNRGAEKMYGWPAEMAVGRLSFELLKTEFPQSLAEIEAELLREGHWEGETAHHTRDGVRLNMATR